MNIDIPVGVQQGWQCPICKRVYSPLTPMCWYCGNDSNSTTKTSTNSSIDDNKLYYPMNNKFTITAPELNKYR